MTVVKQEDFIASVAGALQYISYYHPVDYIKSLSKAYEKEETPAARDAPSTASDAPTCRRTRAMNSACGRSGSPRLTYISLLTIQ